MNLLDLTYVIHLVRTFTTFVTLWEDNNPFKNLFALYIKHTKTYYHLCKEIQDNLGFWIPAFSVELGFRITWAVFWIPKPRISDSTSKIFSDSGISGFLYLQRLFRLTCKVEGTPRLLLRIKQERSSRHRMKSERLVQTDELGGEGHNAKKTWSLILALAPTDNYKLRF